MNIFNYIISTNIKINTITYDKLYIENERLTKYYGGLCLFKKINGNCQNKDTFLIQSINKCVCSSHIIRRKDKLMKIIIFHKTFNMYVKKLFIYTNDQKKYILVLKDILLLMIAHKKYKHTLNNFFNIVNNYINNFEITDIEYNQLLEYYIFN